MRNRWFKAKKMSLDPETESSSTTTTKRSQYRVFIDKVAKLFRSSKCISQESPDPRKCLILPSISVTTPEGETTVVE